MRFRVMYKAGREEEVEADDCYTDNGFMCFRNQGTMQNVKMINCDNVLEVELIE